MKLQAFGLTNPARTLIESQCVLAAVTNLKHRWVSDLSEQERQRLCSFNFVGGPIDDIGDAEIAFTSLGIAAMAWARLETHIEAVLIQVNKPRFG